MGVTWPRLLPNAPVVSYTTVSPLPDSLSFERKIGGMFLWPDPAGNRSAAILLLIAPHPGHYPASCSLECGLSSNQLLGQCIGDRPTDLVSASYYIFICFVNRKRGSLLIHLTA
jgi:hypothetical protein